MSSKEAVEEPAHFVRGCARPLAVDPVATVVGGFDDEVVARSQIAVEPAGLDALARRDERKRRSIEWPVVLFSVLGDHLGRNTSSESRGR
jgi:hypothetical protein